jgi:hypothetical protein
MIRIPYIKVLGITDDFLFATTYHSPSPFPLAPFEILLTHYRDVAIWSTVEPGLGLIAAGGATLRPLFRSFYNLSSNRRSITHPYFPSNAHPRSKSHHSSPSSGHESIRLRNDVVDPRGTVTSVRSPFADSFVDGSEEAWISLRGGASAGEEKDMGAIKVHRTVEISSVQESDEEGVAGLGSPGGSGMGRSERDLV